MFSRIMKLGRWTWLALTVLISASAIGAQFTLHARERDARAKEAVARNFAARLEQSIDELMPIGQYLVAHDPKMLAQMMQGALQRSDERLQEIRAVDPDRSAQIAAAIAQVTSQFKDGRPTNAPLALALIAHAEDLANEIADRERARAEAAERQALIGGVAALALSLLLVALLIRLEGNGTLRAARRHAAEIQHLADHDSLTGLPNRRRFDADLDVLADADGGSVEIAVCDLNHFKDINDRLGHHAGDQVLVAAAHDLQIHVGGAGTVYRTGGDEFCVVSRPGRHVGEAVRRAFEREQSTAIGSVGLATWPSDHVAPRSVVRLADKRMYEVKRALEQAAASAGHPN